MINRHTDITTKIIDKFSHKLKLIASKAKTMRAHPTIINLFLPYFSMIEVE